jgi:hypothetical protein
MVLVLVLVVVGSMLPAVNTLTKRSRINRAVGVASADFYLAQSLAARSRQPVRVEVDPSAKTIELRLYGNDSLIQTRYYGAEGDFDVDELTASPATVLVLPNGMASATMTVSIGSSATFQRGVKLSRAGQIRIIRN